MMGDPGCPAEAMDLEKPSSFPEEGSGNGAGPSSVPCSICLELVPADHRERSVAKLQCGHEFHLDCIGSAFNAKGLMQCPNCRKVEKGRWLYANGYRSFSEFNVDDLVNEDLYDLSYPEMPFGFHWCPFRGSTQLASLFEEGEIHASAYHDLLGASLGDSGSSGGSAHACPYLSLHGFHHAVHTHPAPSNPADTLSDAGLFHRHLTGMGGRSPVDMMNPQNFISESQHHNWQQQQPSTSFSVLSAGDQSASHNMASRFPRDSSGQQRSILRTGSNFVTSLGSPPIGDARGGHGGRPHGGHAFQQSSSSSSFRSGAFFPIRRTRPRRVAFISSIAATSSAEVGGFYGFSLSGTLNGRHQDGESLGRHFDRAYGWGREGFTPLPWVPVEGDPQWWSPFHSGNQNPQPGSLDSASRRYPQRGDTGGLMQGIPENGYQQIPVLRMPPFM